MLVARLFGVGLARVSTVKMDPQLDPFLNTRFFQSPYPSAKRGATPV